MVLFAEIGATNGTPTTYLALTAVLVFLVFLTFWREMSSGSPGQFFTRSFAALSFVGSRLVAVVFTGAIIADRAAPPALFMLLNFVSFYLAAICLPPYPRATRAGSDTKTDHTDKETESIRRRFRTQVVLYAIACAVIYAVVPKPQFANYSISWLATAALGGATIRVFMEVARAVRYVAKELHVVLFAWVSFVVASWLLVIGASILVGDASAVMLQAARASDIFSLVSGLLALQSNFLILGFYHKHRAETNKEEVEKVKAELSLMSRVASDIYEDSSSMIQRQQDHSRDLMRRIESLEKILQIGITIQKRKNLRDLLQMIAELIKDNLGFNTVILRLLNDRTKSFETKAFVGLSEEAEDAVVNYRLPMVDYERMIDPRFRISKSYYVKRASLWDDAHDDTGEAEVLAMDQWVDVDRLIIPLIDERDRTVGYISVEDPVNSGTSVVDAIDNLETVATLVVIAIRNARFIRDIAEKNDKLKLYAEKLSSLNKMKSNFVATISHEFRTPLTSIKAYCETLLKNADDVDRNILKEFLIVIDEESDRLMALIEDILDFSQMESGAIKFERTPCNLNELITIAADEMKKNFERKNITLHQELPADGGEVMVRAERDLIKQLMINLLHNASKFTEEDGDVWIRLEEETVSARITVEDNGIGIPEDQVEMIFDHFTQVDNTTTREYGGSGLGLAICKNIVDWHDGKIWVENAPGRGTKFVVVIPRKQAVVRSHVLSPDGTMRRYEIERYLELLIEMVTELMNVRKASIMMLDGESRELRVECAVGMDEEIVENGRVKLGEGISGRVALKKESFLVTDIDKDTRINIKNNDFLYDSRSFLCVPIMSGEEVIGVINAADPDSKESFDTGDRHLLEVFSIRLSEALTRLRSFTGASQDFEEVRTALKAILDSKRYVDDQGTDAMRLVLSEIAERLGFTGEETATLLYAFNIYDVGLANIGHNVVKQPRQLTGKDRKAVEQHTIIGTELLESLEQEPRVRDAVLYHHENFDGTGYPNRLSGEEIPILARILRVADSFRALISHRPYQKQYTVGEALDILKHRSGTFFDPKITKIFADVVKKQTDDFNVAYQPARDRDTVNTLINGDESTNSRGGN